MHIDIDAGFLISNLFQSDNYHTSGRLDGMMVIGWNKPGFRIGQPTTPNHGRPKIWRVERPDLEFLGLTVDMTE